MLAQWFDADGFMPHGMCYLWQPAILGLHVGADSLIAAAYLSISVTLWYFLRRRRDLEFNWIVGCFALFIVACGATHLMEIWTIWRPDYWLSGFVKLLTAAASVPTALLLIRLMPTALQVPSPAALESVIAQLQGANRELQDHERTRMRMELDIQATNRELKEQVAARERQLGELEHLRAQLSKQLEDLGGLHELSMRLADTHDLAHGLEQILDAVISLQQADFGLIELYDDSTDRLDVFAFRGFSPDFIREPRPNRWERSVGLTVARSGRRIDIEDLEAQSAGPIDRSLGTQEEFRALQAIPIVGHAGRVTGVFALLFRKPRAATAQESRMTDLYLRIAAQLIDRVQDEERLRAARDEAQKASLTKGRFLATASHDLRQPLQTLSLLNGALRRSASGVRVMETLAEQELAIGAMSQLLNALLDISKLESGKIQAQPLNLELDALFDRLRVEFRDVAAKKSLRFEVHRTGFVVFTDRTLLAQVLGNLLSNAIRYTQTGVVELRAAATPEGIRIEVADTGIGIPREELPHIFEEFYQVVPRDNAAREGHGLGLNIVMRVARLLEHPLDVRSEPGAGSVFSIMVPPGTSERDAVAEPSAPSPATAPERRRILVVDDNPSVLKATRLLLELEGYEVMTATTVAEAVACARNARRLNLLITDFHLQNEERGPDVIVALRSIVANDLKVVLVTGDTSTIIRKSAEDGDINLITKPINAEELLNLAGSLLRG